MKYTDARTPTFYDISAAGDDVDIFVVPLDGSGKYIRDDIKDLMTTRYPAFDMAYQNMVKNSFLSEGSAFIMKPGALPDKMMIGMIMMADRNKSSGTMHLVDEGSRHASVLLRRELKDLGPDDAKNVLIAGWDLTKQPAVSTAARILEHNFSGQFSDNINLTIQGSAPEPSSKQVIIDQFQGPNRFMSNMWTCKNEFSWGNDAIVRVKWNNVELPYQMAKSTDPADHKRVFEAYEAAEKDRFGSGPYAAKKAGKTVKMRPDWDQVKRSFMEGLVSAKYRANPDLAAQLIKTINMPIREGNKWGDTYWGVALHDNPAKNIISGQGQNVMGNITNKVRVELREMAREEQANAGRVSETSPQSQPKNAHER